MRPCAERDAADLQEMPSSWWSAAARMASPYSEARSPNCSSSSRSSSASRPTIAARVTEKRSNSPSPLSCCGRGEQAALLGQGRLVEQPRCISEGERNPVAARIQARS